MALVVGSVVAPTLVVAGGPRSFVAAEHVAELVAALPDGRSVTLDTGHEVHETDPDGFTREVAAPSSTPRHPIRTGSTAQDSRIGMRTPCSCAVRSAMS